MSAKDTVAGDPPTGPRGVAAKVETPDVDGSATPARDAKNQVNSVAKAFRVLQAFTPVKRELTITEVAAAAGIDRGTAFRLIQTLVGLGYLNGASARRYRLSLKCLELGFLALSDQDLRTHAEPFLDECVPSLVDAASLGALDGADVVYLARADTGLSRHKLDRRPGRRIQAYASALGHCMLAHRTEDEQIRILQSAERIKLAEHTLIDLDSLLERLSLVRRQGYAVSDGENAYGLRTVAAPVLDPKGVAVAGISLTVDADRMPIERLIEIGVPRALAITSDLSRALRLAAGSMPVPYTA